MLRHGVTDFNERRVFTGAGDIPLSPKGMERLAAERDKYPPANIFFTSGMLRARQTLQILYGDVPHVDIPALAEYNFGVYEGRSHDDLYENEPVYRKWLAQDLDIACPGGETRRGFSVRVRGGFEALTAQEWAGLAVLVTHGGVLYEIAAQMGPETDGLTHPDNGAGWLALLAADGTIETLEAFG